MRRKLTANAPWRAATTAAYRRRAAAALAALLIGLAPGVRAHHGFGTFDLKSDIELTGTVTGLDFVNPHSWLYLDVPQPDGSVSAYRCEMRAATVLRRSGWSPEMFVIGNEITISGSPDREDPNSCYVSTVIFADGSTIDRYGQRTAATREPESAERPLRRPGGEPNISGDWAPEQFVMTDPRGQAGTLVPLSQAADFGVGGVPEGREAMGGTRESEQTGAAGQGEGDQAAAPAPRPGPWSTSPVEFTARGQAAADAFEMWDPADNPRMRCETTSIIFDWDFDGPVNRITQYDDRITLEYGQYGFTRTIEMNADAHPENIVPSRAGHSIGRWEDDVLIVDTVGFAPGVLSPPVLNSEQLHVVERFSFDPATMQLTRRYEATDPEFFTDVYIGSDTVGLADLRYSPDACRELTFVDYSEEGQPAGATDVAAEPADQEAEWWEFWKWFD